MRTTTTMPQRRGEGHAGSAWLTVAIGVAIALRHARAGTAIVVLTAASVVFSTHMAADAIGLLALTAAVALRESHRAGTPAVSTPTAGSAHTARSARATK